MSQESDLPKDVKDSLSCNKTFEVHLTQSYSRKSRGSMHASILVSAPTRQEAEEAALENANNLDWDYDDYEDIYWEEQGSAKVSDTDIVNGPADLEVLPTDES